MVRKKVKLAMVICTIIVGAILAFNAVRSAPKDTTAMDIPLSADYFHAKCWDIHHLESKITDSDISLKRSTTADTTKAREYNQQLRSQRSTEIARYNMEAKRLKDQSALARRGLPQQLNDGAVSVSCSR